MKTHLNLGLVFIDAYGSRRLSFQLMPDGGRYAIATADYVHEINTRLIHSEKCPPREVGFFRALTDKLASNRAQKSLEWAYKSSPNAESFGHGQTGCWCAELGLPGEPSHVVQAFKDTEFPRALDYVRGLPFPWSPITLRVHPEYSETLANA